MEIVCYKEVYIFNYFLVIYIYIFFCNKLKVNDVLYREGFLLIRFFGCCWFYLKGNRSLELFAVYMKIV